VRLTNIALQYRISANKKALKRIQQANVIILGPGDHYGSIIPNLLVPGIGSAIKHSRAKVIYICSLTNKKGLTLGWDLQKYVSSLEEYIGKRRIDYVMYNTKRMPEKLIRKYEQQEGKNSLVLLGNAENTVRSYKIVKGHMVSVAIPKSGKGDTIAKTRSFIRHDPKKLAQAIMLLLEFESSGRIIEDII